MNRTKLKAAVAASLVIGLVSASGCIIRREPVDEPASSRTQRTTESVALGSAKSAMIDVSMGAGELAVEAADLTDATETRVLDGTFTFAPAQIEPIVTSEAAADPDVLEVQVTQPDIREFDILGRNVSNRWDLKLNRAVPCDLRVALGAGEAKLDLAGLDAGDLNLDMGAGDLELDLTGPRTRDLGARISAGVGRVEVTLPQDVGVRVSGRQDGLGDWSYDGFTVDGAYLVNDAYGTTPYSIELDIQRGIGEVVLQLED